MDLHGKRVTVMGLGHFGGGATAARWLADRGARVTVTDLADEQALASSLATLQRVPIERLRLGGHDEDDFRQADLVVVNPAVRPGHPLVAIARQAGARLTTEIELFMRACPAMVVGVTGSNGKSTTAAMTAAIFEAAGRRTWLGGNIGGSLLEQLDRMTANDRVVLELSSFQLYYLADDAPRPHVAIVTSCTPNHLDWHPTFADYAAAKQRLLTGQTCDDLAVLNPFDPEVNAWQSMVRGELLSVDVGQAVNLPESSRQVGNLPHVGVPGRHNRLNAALATAAAVGAGCSGEAARHALESFKGLPQRLEQVAVVEGRRFYNDSTATTPESTIAAMEALDGPVWLLAGGRDKGCDFTAMIAAIASRARGAAFFGSVATTLQQAVAARRPDMACTAVETMDEALAWCWARSRPGDAVILSPACSSHDQFRNFRQRGERFVELVAELATFQAIATRSVSEAMSSHISLNS